MRRSGGKGLLKPPLARRRLRATAGPHPQSRLQRGAQKSPARRALSTLSRLASSLFATTAGVAPGQRAAATALCHEPDRLRSSARNSAGNLLSRAVLAEQASGCLAWADGGRPALAACGLRLRVPPFCQLGIRASGARSGGALPPPRRNCAAYASRRDSVPLGRSPPSAAPGPDVQHPSGPASSAADSPGGLRPRRPPSAPVAAPPAVPATAWPTRAFRCPSPSPASPAPFVRDSPAPSLASALSRPFAFLACTFPIGPCRISPGVEDQAAWLDICRRAVASPTHHRGFHGFPRQPGRRGGAAVHFRSSPPGRLVLAELPLGAGAGLRLSPAPASAAPC